MTDPVKGPGGRPTTFSDEIASEICARLAEGNSLRSICRADDMPGLSTVFQWLKAQAGFAEQYARAREAQADALFDEILEIADDATNDWMERNGDDGVAYSLNGEHVQRSRIRIDARKWMAGKLRPKVYGEKQAHDHTSSDGSMTPKPSVDLSKAPPELLEWIVAQGDASKPG